MLYNRTTVLSLASSLPSDSLTPRVLGGGPRKPELGMKIEQDCPYYLIMMITYQSSPKRQILRPPPSTWRCRALWFLRGEGRGPRRSGWPRGSGHSGRPGCSSPRPNPLQDDQHPSRGSAVRLTGGAEEIPRMSPVGSPTAWASNPPLAVRPRAGLGRKRRRASGRRPALACPHTASNTFVFPPSTQ